MFPPIAPLSKCSYLGYHFPLWPVLMVTSGIQLFLPPPQEILFQQRQAPTCHLTSKKNSLLPSAPTCSKPTLLNMSLPQGRPPCRAPASYRHLPPGPHLVLASRMLSKSESHSVMSYTVNEILQARILEWVACPFSRGSSWPRNRTRVSCTAGRFFPHWAIRKAAECSICPYYISKGRFNPFIDSFTQFCSNICGIPLPYQVL